MFILIFMFCACWEGEKKDSASSDTSISER